MTRHLGCLVLCAALLGGCGEEQSSTSGSTPTATPEPTEPTEGTAGEDEAPPTPLGDVMRGHFSHATDARTALIRGDVETARTHMEWLATHDRGNALPEHLRPLQAQLQSEAAHFAEATTLTEAGTALARTLTRCGGCHRVAEAGPQIATPPVPEGESVAEHMRRHRWAADRMWEGLVLDDAEIYQAGATVLQEGSLFAHDLHGEAAAPEARVQAIATHVHELGQEASQATDATERAAVYGRLLASCATCHRMLGVGGQVEGAEGAPTEGAPTEGAAAE